MLPAPRAPTRPRLAPGLRVVERGRHHLQVGLHGGRRVLLRRTPVVERTVAALLGDGQLDEDPRTAAVLDLLDRHGCLDEPAGARPDTATVVVLGRLDVPALPDAATLLRRGGVCVPAPGPAGGARADVALVLSTGELPRERIDVLVREGTSHLVVRLVDGCALIGPFVTPGVTACLRCIDAHESVRDPDHVAVTTRYVRATSRPRGDGVPDADPALAAVALTWAVRDVLGHLAGHEPSTWSRTIRLGPRPGDRSESDWRRHPQCGCSWPPELADQTGADAGAPPGLHLPARDRSSGTMDP